MAMLACKRITALFLLVFVVLSSQNALAQKVRFMVIGDWGREGHDFQTLVAQAMTKQAKADHSTFVLSTGDNFYEDGVRAVTDSQFQTSFERVYHDRSLQIPWYVALGNHDYRTSPEAQIAYSTVSKRWKMPARYYTEEVPVDDTTTALFMIIDTSPFIEKLQKQDSIYHVLAQPTTFQLAWMDSVLSHSHAKWKFAVGHHPIFSAAKEAAGTPELIAQVLPVLTKYGVQAYFCGHSHNLQHLVNGRLTTYVSGGGSKAEPIKHPGYSLFAVESPGFLSVTLTSTKLTGAFYDWAGKLLDRSSSTP